MKKYITIDLLKIIICILVIILSFLLKDNKISFLLLGVAYIVISYKMYIESYQNIKEGEIFDENFLMIIATIGAFLLENYIEAILVMLLFQIGEYLEDLAISKSEKSITNLMDLRVEEITLEEKGKVKIEEAKIGDIFLVKPGERIPLDGVIVEGESYLDTSSLTGESKPKKVQKKDSILSGCINREGVLKVKATSTYQTSTSQRLLDLVKNAEEKKSDTESMIHRFAKVYTPTICALAVLIVVLPTLMGGDLKTWFYRSLVFLVTSCPCALVISVPLGYFCGIGKSSKEGIIVKGSKELEKLEEIDTILLDKTGTITEGTFKVTAINSKIEENEFLKLMASAESSSIHPIATAIKEKYSKKLEKVTDYQEISGKGIHCKIEKKEILVGNKKLLEDNHIEVEEPNEIGTIIYLAINQEYQGYLVISDKIKDSSRLLKNLPQELIILSGDNADITKKIAKEVMQEAYEEMKENITPKFTNNLSKIISVITSNKYNKVKFNDENGIMVELKNGDYMQIDNLSIGTIEQLYLSLRVSMIDELSEEKLPLFLDETFAYYDEERLQNVLIFLVKEAAKRQIFIFTCSKREIDLLNSLNIKYNLIEL